MKRPRKTPTFKQKQFAKKYIEHKGNGTKAALEIYDTDYEGAKSVARQNLQKEVVLQEIDKQLNEAGLDINTLNRKSKRIVDQIDTEKPNPKLFATATNHLQFLYKLHNVLPASKKMSMNMNVNQVLGNKSVDELTQAVEKLNELTSSLVTDLKSKS